MFLPVREILAAEPAIAAPPAPEPLRENEPTTLAFEAVRFAYPVRDAP